MMRSLVAAAAAFAIAGLAPAAVAAQKQASNPKQCSGLSEHDQQILTRLPRQNILAVDKLMEMPLSQGDPPVPGAPVLRGVTISVRPVEGLTAERLQHLVTCGIARAAAADPSQPTDWPRTPPGTVPYVHSGGDRFFIDLRTRDEAAADEIWKSAQSLKSK
jgi:hypothetical protein